MLAASGRVQVTGDDRRQRRTVPGVEIGDLDGLTFRAASLSSRHDVVGVMNNCSPSPGTATETVYQ
jgi:hypothetical protein